MVCTVIKTGNPHPFKGSVSDQVRTNTLKDCPAWKDNGLTLGEKELAIIRALGLMVMDSTQRMFRFQTEVEEHDA